MSSDVITPTSVVDDDDDVEALIDSAMGSSSEFTCQVCGIPLTYSGRGRHPKYCDEHKPKPGRSSSPTAKSTTKLRDEFLSQWNMLAVTVGLAVNPIDGQILLGGGPRLADSVLHLSEVNPKFRKAINKAMEATVWGELIAAMSPMAIMIAANHNMIKLPPMMVATMAEGLNLKVDE